MTRRKKVLVLLAGLTAFGVGFLSTLRSAPADERFDFKVRDDFFAGFNGDQQALARGMKACENALAENPKNAEALVWHGGGLYYQGGQAFQAGDSDTGNGLVQRGLAEMGRAVALEPENLAVRIPRGSILLHSTLFMPEGDYRRPLIEQGLADYQKTLDLQQDHFAVLGVHSRGELLSGIANAHWRLGNTADAEKTFRRISSELKGTVYQTRADKWLSRKTLDVSDMTCAGCHTGN
jgi:tetratricopeptide (TPR) repeat protein